MSFKIVKIRLINFKRFIDYTVFPNDRVNILVGDNEVGKSSILEAIDLVANGNVHRVESIGLDRLINIDAVKSFEKGKKCFENLPSLKVELFLSDEKHDFTLNGKNNSDSVCCNGIRLVCEPNQDYINEISSVLSEDPGYFPYDYYSIRFSTFADEGYTGLKKKIRATLIDSSVMNTMYATSDFVRRMYIQYTENNIRERTSHKSKYRQIRDAFQASCLSDLNKRIPGENHYSFGLRKGSSSIFESDLMIYKDDIEIDRKGTGEQIFIKTDFALARSKENADVILVEEPENHLSPVNLRKLIQLLALSQNGQLFITTHNSLISTRLELQNLLIMRNKGLQSPVTLNNLDMETAKYFMKAPPANIIEFALAKKVVLVEGPSEYMLMEKFYFSSFGQSLEKDDIHIIDIRGLSFKRFLEVAKLTGSKVAVFTDNDNDFQKHCIDKYKDYKNENNIQIFYENNNDKRTFEIVLYDDNKQLCDNLFGNQAIEYMLNNKTEVAYKLLSLNANIKVPDYIFRGLEWIRE